MDNTVIKCIKKYSCYYVCSQSNCTKNPFMCLQEDCECVAAHSNCLRNIKWNKFKQKIEEKIMTQPLIYKKYLNNVQQMFSNIQKQLAKCFSMVKQNLIYLGISQNLRDFSKKLRQAKYQDINGMIISQIQKQLKRQIYVPNEQINFDKQKEDIKISLDKLLQNVVTLSNPFANSLINRQNYKFSSTTKGKSIIISKNQMYASQKEDLERFAIIQPKLTIHKKHKIQFQICKLSWWIGIGICFKNKVLKNNYKFEYPFLSHGSYLISNNNFSWLNSKNYIQNNFRFQTQDILSVQFNPFSQELIFVNQTKKKTIKIDLDFDSKDDIQNLNFCVALAPKDEIKILELNI